MTSIYLNQNSNLFFNLKEDQEINFFNNPFEGLNEKEILEKSWLKDFQFTPPEDFNREEKNEMYFSSFIHSLKNGLDFMAKQGFKLPTLDIKRYEDCFEILKKINSENHETVINELISKAQQLKKNEFILLPGGYSGENAEFMLYKITKQKNGKFTFTTISSKGNEFHDSIANHEKEKYLSHLTLKDIKAEKIYSPQFFKHIIDLQSKVIENRNVNEKSIYFGLFNYLEGKVEKIKKIPASNYKTTAVNENTTFKTLNADLLLQLSEHNNHKSYLEDYKILKFFMKKEELLARVTFYLNSGEYNRTGHKIISLMASQLASAAHKLLNKHPLFDEKIIKNLQCTIVDIKERLATHKNKYQVCEEANPINYELNELNKIVSAPELIYLRPLNSYLGHDFYRTNFEIKKNQLEDFPLIELTTSDQIKEFLNHSIVNLKSLDSIEIKTLNHVIRMLPIPTVENDLWNQVNPEDINEILSQLEILSKMFYYSDLTNPEAHTLPLYILFSIGDKLARRLPESLLTNEDKVSYNELLFFFWSTERILEHPKDHERLIQLLKYFDPKFDSSEILTYEKQYEKSREMNNLDEETIFFIKNSFSSYAPDELSDDHDPHFLFLKRYLNSDKTKKVLQEENLLDKSITIQMLSLLSESKIEAKLLPKSIHLLRQLAFATKACNTFKSKFLKYKDCEFKFSQIPPTKDNPRWYSRFHLNIENLHHPVTIRNSFDSQYDFKDQNKKFYNLPNSSKNVYSQNFSNSTYLLEELREETLITCNPEDEIMRVLAYFSNCSLEKLENPEIQQILYLHFFKPGRLLLQIQREPKSIIKIYAFIANFMNRFIQQNKLQPAAFFAAHGHRCKKLIDEYLNANLDKFNEDELKKIDQISGDFRKTLLDSIKEASLDLSSYADISFELAMMHETNFDLATNPDPEAIRNIAVDLLIPSLIMPLAMLEDPKKINQHQHRINRLNNSRKEHEKIFLKEMIQNEGIRNDICNTIFDSINKFLPKKFNNTNWVIDGTTFISSNKEFGIDIEKEMILIDGKPLIGLPLSFIKTKQFPKLFKNIQTIRSLEKSNTIIEIKDEHGISRVNLLFNIDIDREFADSEGIFRYIPIEIMPRSFLQAIPFNFLDPEDKKTSIWLKTKEHKDDRQYYILEDHTTNKKFYIHLKEIGRETTIDYISDSLYGQRTLINPESIKENLSFLARFMPFENIAFWADLENEGCLKEIEIPHMNLHFTIQNVEGDDRAFCREVPGYYISPNQEESYVGRDNQSIILMNSLGQKKVLKAKGNYTSNENQDYDPNVVFKPSLNKNSITKYIVFDLHEKDGTLRLKPTNISDTLQLISFLFLKKQYKQARYYLKYLQGITKYTKKDVNAIFYLIKYKDFSPSAIALKLKLLVLLKENTLKFEASNLEELINKDEAKEVAFLFKLYLQNLSKCHINVLTIEDEKFILQLLQKQKAIVFPVLAQRIAFILNPNSLNLKKGIKTALKLPPAKKLSEFKLHEFYNLYATKENSHKLNVNEISTVSIENFTNLLPELYQIARHGNESERNKLKDILNLLEGSNALSVEENITHACFLKNVCLSPDKFPAAYIIKKYSSFIYEGKFKKDHPTFWNDYRQLQQKWNMERTAAFKVIQKYGKNSRASGLIDTIKGAVNLIKKINLCPESMGKKLQKSEPTFSNEKNKIAAKEIDLNPQIVEKDHEWNSFFNSFFDENFFDIQINEIKKSNEMHEDLPQGKKRTLIENMEKFYETMPESEEQYTFNTLRQKDFTDKVSHYLDKYLNKLVNESQNIILQIQNEKPNLKIESIEDKIELLLLIRRYRIEHLASLLPKDSSLQTNLNRLSKKEVPLSINELIALFEIGTKESYVNSSKFSEEQSLELDKEIGLFGIDLTRCLQLKQALVLLKEINHKEDESEKRILNQRLGEQIKIKRSHLSNGNVERSRSYLRFEMQEGILLRPIQVSVLDELISQEEPLQLLQILGTGSGKTAILSPMEQWIRRKNGNRLLMNVWPNQHYTENKKLIGSQVIENYNQRSDSFDFNRQSSITPDSLFFMYKELKKAIYEKRQLNTTPESLQNFELRFLEVLFNISNEGISYPPETVPLFQKILNVLKEAEIHVDEGHKNFSPKREVNFTIGDPSIEKSENVSLIASIYEMLISDEELNALIKLRTNEQNYLTEEDFHQKVVPKLINFFAEKFDIPENTYYDFSNYVSKKDEALPDSLKSHKNLELIALLRGELIFILKETLSKNTSVHYGLSKKDKDLKYEYAKPYDANDSCVETAEYDNTTEALNKTFQTYIYKRLTFEQQKKLIEFLKDSIENEIDQKPIGYSFKDTSAYKFYIENFPKEMTEKSIFSLTDVDIKNNFENINSHDSIIFYYIKMIVVPQIKKYRYSLKSDAQNLRSMFKDVTTLTATPGSVHTYGFSKSSEMTEKTLNHGNDFEVLNMLNIKCLENSHFNVIPSEIPKEIIQEIISLFSNEDKGIRMLTDIGALFKGLSNFSIAKEILNQVPYIKGVVFYNENDHLMVLEREGNRVIPLKECMLKPHERFTYCDNKHMFGSDTKQAPNAVGICTFGLHNDLDDLLQGVGRLREFLKDQDAIWVATESTMKTIDSEYANKGSLFALIRDHALANQENNEKENLFRSVKQQMRNEIRSACMRKLIKSNSSNVLDFFKKFKSILVNEDPKDPLLMYGNKQESISALLALKSYKEKIIGILNTVKSGFTKSEYQEIIKNLNYYEKKIEEFEKKNFIPKEVNEFNGELGTEAEIQIQVETETEVEVETLVQSTLGLNNRTEGKWPNDLDIFSKNWIKPTSLNTIMKKVKFSSFDIANIFKDYFFYPSNFTKGLLKDITKIKAIKPADIKKVKIVKTLHFVIKTINTIAFIIFGLPIYILLGAIGAGMETFKFIFMRNKKVKDEIKVSKYGRKRAKKACKTKVPLYKIEEVIKLHSEKTISNAIDLFKPNNGHTILFTNNLVCKLPQKKNEVTMKVLGREQKTIHEILVVEDTINGKKQYTIIAGDQFSDAKFFRKKLAEDKLNESKIDASARTRKICLYDLSMGIVQNCNNPIDENELTNDPNFLSLLTQIKFFNGEIKYNEKEETELLKIWGRLFKPIDSKEKVNQKIKIITNFIDRSLAWKDKKAKLYNGSRLRKIVNAKRFVA